MRGVVIVDVKAAAITSVWFHLEPVKETSGDVDAHTQRAVGAAATDAAGVRS